MRTYLIVFSIVTIVLGCRNIKPDLNTSNKSVKADIKTDLTFRLGDFMSDTTDYFWTAKQSDTSRYDVRIVFQKEFVVYQFHGQCIYNFFTNYYHTGVDKIELIWSFKSDCLLDMSFLKNSYGIKRYPNYGDIFCEYRLVNDSIIKVKYNYSEWADKINRLQQDSIFPKYLYLEKRAANNK